MKIFLRISYFVMFLVIVFMIYLEYNNYQILNYEIDTSKYFNEIEKLKNNINIISNYNTDDYKLMNTINRCSDNIRYKEILDKEFIDIADIYFIDRNTVSGVCNGMDYDIKNLYNDNEDVNLYQYINIYNDKNIDDVFKVILNNEINITSAFIEMIEYLKGDYDV